MPTLPLSNQPSYSCTNTNTNHVYWMCSSQFWTTLIGQMKLGKNLFPLSTLPHSAVGRASLHPLRFPNWVGQPDQVTTLQLLSCLFLASCQPDRLPTLLVKREIWEAGGWVVRKRGKERGSNTTSNLTPRPIAPTTSCEHVKAKV